MFSYLFTQQVSVLLLVGFFVFLGQRSTSLLVGGQSLGQPPPVVPDIRQLLYAPMSAFDSVTKVGAAAAVANPNPCTSLDAQYPDRPCSPTPQQLPNPDYLPTPTLAFYYQPQSLPTQPQYAMSAPSPAALPSRPADYLNFLPYPYVNNKQLDIGNYILKLRLAESIQQPNLFYLLQIELQLRPMTKSHHNTSDVIFKKSFSMLSYDMHWFYLCMNFQEEY